MSTLSPDCRAAPGRVHVADRHDHGALALARELGLRPLVAHCHVGLGNLYQSTGKREQAQEHLTTAMAMCREMDMRFWLEKADRAMKALPTNLRPRRLGRAALTEHSDDVPALHP